jgi:hypothetical protein
LISDGDMIEYVLLSKSESKVMKISFLDCISQCIIVWIIRKNDIKRGTKEELHKNKAGMVSSKTAAIFSKYDGKTIRLKGHKYIMHVYEVARHFEHFQGIRFGKRLLYVELCPKAGGWTANNFVSYDSWEYKRGDDAFREAVGKSHEVATKIEKLMGKKDCM